MHVPMLLKAFVLAIMIALDAVPLWAQQQAGANGECVGAVDTIAGTALDQLASVRFTVPNTGAD
jgi:hypothetical protein